MRNKYDKNEDYAKIKILFYKITKSINDKRHFLHHTNRTIFPYTFVC